MPTENRLSELGELCQIRNLQMVVYLRERNWVLLLSQLRSKFVDDTEALEIIPRNPISYLNNTVEELYQFPINQNITLNPLKCKEVVINFVNNNNSIMNPLY